MTKVDKSTIEEAVDCCLEEIHYSLSELREGIASCPVESLNDLQEVLGERKGRIADLAKSFEYLKGLKLI